jgi:hypothetical protein
MRPLHSRRLRETGALRARIGYDRVLTFVEEVRIDG